MKKFVIPLMIIGIILFLLVHHAMTHENKDAFDPIDFKIAVNGNFKSHEGIILTVLIVGVGIMIGDFIHGS